MGLAVASSATGEKSILRGHILGQEKALEVGFPRGSTRQVRRVASPMKGLGRLLKTFKSGYPRHFPRRDAFFWLLIFKGVNQAG